MRKVQVFFPLLITLSALVTGLVVGADAWLQDRSDRNLAFELSRQTAAQVEGLTLSVRAEGRKQSLEWAVSQLTQGPLDRRIRISKIHDASAVGSELEKISFNKEKRILTYAKILSVAEGQGVRVEVALPFRGFLGTEHRATRDAAVLILFAWCFTVGWAVVRIKIKGEVLPTPNVVGISSVFRTEKSAAPSVASEPSGQDYVWVPGLKAGLKEIGLKFRDTFLRTKEVAVSAARAESHVKTLHEKLSVSLNGLKNLNHDPKTVDELFSRSVDIVETLRKVIDQPRLFELGHILIQLKREHEKSRQMMAHLEKAVEPLAHHASRANQALASMEGLVAALDLVIPETKAALMAQAKLVQEIEIKAAEHTAPASASTTTASSGDSEAA